MKSLHLLYHELRPAPSSYSYALERCQFERHCDLFARLRQSPTRSFLPEITFDDGHGSNYEFALPILDNRGLKAHFFVTAGWINTRAQYLSWDELRVLHAAGHRIGAHGWSHTLLTHCTAAQLDQELSNSRRKLEDELSAPITTMSLPGGRANGRVYEACWTAGYTEVFTSVPRAEPVSRTPRATVGRLNIRSLVTTDWLEKVLEPESGVLTKLERREQLKSGAKTLLGDKLYARLWALLNHHESEPDTAGVPPQ